MLSKKMREIKFKGKRKDNGKWIVGSETFIRDGDGIWLSDEDINVELVDEETVGQFTGKRDKNGKDIYEGDIVKAKEFLDSDEELFVCHYWKPAQRFLFSGTKYGYVLFNPAKSENVGNVHENPELLERRQNENEKYNRQERLALHSRL